MSLQPAYQEHSLEGLDNERVEALWSFRPLQRAYHRVLPDGRADLLVRFKLKENGLVSNIRPIIAGPTQCFATVPADQDTGFLGIRFCPGWGGACLGVNAPVMRDNVLVGSGAMQVLGVLYAPLSTLDTVDQLKRQLIETARTLIERTPVNAQSARAFAAIRLLDCSGGRKSVASLANEVGTSVRTLHRDISAAVGFSAKSLASIFRFQRTMRLLRKQPSITLTELAFEGGYSDQAHMTREFRDLGGFTPGARPDVTVINLSA